jgi:hypothetical protein
VKKRALFYGNEKDHALSDQIYASLHSKVPISFYNQDVLMEAGEDTQIELIETDHLKSLYADRTIIYFKNKCDLHPLKTISGDITAVVNANYRRQLAFVSRHHLKTVTYGFSNRDTVTFSSRDDERLVISLQRSVYTLDGVLIDPMEIPCRISGERNDLSILAYVAILILLGELRLGEDGYLNL